MSSEYVNVKELPGPVLRALESAHYGRPDIEVVTITEVILGGSAYGDGYQAFTTLVNLTTEESVKVSGSWGGPNPFDTTNPVDNDERAYVLPADGVVIKGQRGGGRPVSARLYISSATRNRILTSGPAETLTTMEIAALCIYRSIKSSYRRDYLARAHVTPETIDSLVTRGYLKRNRAGAVQITTSGKNAAMGHSAD